MGRIKQTKLIYKAPDQDPIKYAADTCIFATKSDKDESVETFMDGDISSILKMFVGLFQNLLKQNADLAYYFIDACMKILSEKVGVASEEILEEIEKIEAENLLDDD